MTDAEDILDRAQQLRAQLRAVHGIRGRSLGQALARSGRFVPRNLRREAQMLVDVEPMLGHPKLERQIDFDALRAAHDRIAAHLDKVDAADIRRGRWLSLAAAIAFNLLLVGTLFVIWMVRTGQI